MSVFRRNQNTIRALIDRKVIPLGASDYVIRTAKRRAWISIRRGERAAVAMRDAISYAAEATDKATNQSGVQS